MSRPGPNALTTREREVLDLLRHGLTNEEIAERLGITLDGAKYHVSQILSKLGVATREEAAALSPAPQRRWWSALPLAAKAAGAALVVAAVAGLGMLAWGVFETSDDIAESGTSATSTPDVVLGFRVEGAAMEPTLSNGTLVPVEPYEGGQPERGHIVVFVSPVVPGRSFVKRVIGLPGDVLEIESTGRVLINGVALEESYVSSATQCSTATCSWHIPGADSPESQEACGSGSCYFVMGDNRQNSSDSRQGWLVGLESIQGLVTPVATP